MSEKNRLFANQAQVREKEQRRIESRTEKADAPKRTERTTLSLSITKEDKWLLMEYADRTGVTAANVIHQLIQTLSKD